MEIVNFAIKSLVFQNTLLNGAYSFQIFQNISKHFKTSLQELITIRDLFYKPLSPEGSNVKASPTERCLDVFIQWQSEHPVRCIYSNLARKVVTSVYTICLS